MAAAPAVTGFNFMGAAAPAPSEDTSANTSSATSFSFLASGGAQTAAAPPASGFAFTKPASGGSSSSLPVSGLHTTGMGGLGGSGGAAAAPLAGPAALGADLATGGIKKKKPGFRPGFARAEDGAAPGGSVLSGLTVHEDVANTSVDGGAAGGDGGSGGLLAGMRLHAASDATEDSAANDLRRGSVSSVNNHGSSSGSVLAGLQVHSASAAAAAAAGETGSVSSGNTPIKTTAGVVGGRSTPGVTGFSFVAGGPAAAPEAGDNEAGSSSESIFGGSLRKTGSASSMPSSSAIGTEGAPSVGAGMGAIGSNVGSAFPPSFNASSSTAAVGAAAFTSPTASASSKSSGGNRGTSPTARMRTTLTDLNDAARRTRMRLADLKIRLRGLVDQDRKASAEVDKLQLKVSEIESKQDEAIKNEQFEEAEALNESLDSVKGSLAAAEGRRKVISDEKQRVEAEQAQVFSESLAVTSMTVVGLKQYNEDRVNKLTTFRKEANSRHSVVIERVHDQEEQLRLKEEHVARDIKTVGSPVWLTNDVMCDGLVGKRPCLLIVGLFLVGYCGVDADGCYSSCPHEERLQSAALTISLELSLVGAGGRRGEAGGAHHHRADGGALEAGDGAQREAHPAGTGGNRPRASPGGEATGREASRDHAGRRRDAYPGHPRQVREAGEAAASEEGGCDG